MDTGFFVPKNKIPRFKKGLQQSQGPTFCPSALGSGSYYSLPSSPPCSPSGCLCKPQHLLVQLALSSSQLLLDATRFWNRGWRLMFPPPQAF